MNGLAEIKVIVFDMDGTLYQEDSFMDRYIRYLLEGTELEAETEAAIREAASILSGEHAVKLGHFCHHEDNVVLVHDGGRFVEALTWEGETVDQQEFMKRYGQLSLDDPGHHYMGDPWGIVEAISQKFKISKEKLIKAYDRVREEMILEPYQFSCHNELFEAIRTTDAVDKKILMTNSNEQSGIDFLEYMKIISYFDEIHCGADKPQGIQKFFQSLLDQGYQPHEILSIGDNPWNDLYPVKRMGGRTCYISPYSSVELERLDLRLHSLDELVQLLNDIQQAKEEETVRYKA